MKFLFFYLLSFSLFLPHHQSKATAVITTLTTPEEKDHHPSKTKQFRMNKTSNKKVYSFLDSDLLINNTVNSVKMQFQNTMDFSSIPPIYKLENLTEVSNSTDLGYPDAEHEIALMYENNQIDSKDISKESILPYWFGKSAFSYFQNAFYFELKKPYHEKGKKIPLLFRKEKKILFLENFFSKSQPIFFDNLFKETKKYKSYKRLLALSHTPEGQVENLVLLKKIKLFLEENSHPQMRAFAPTESSFYKSLSKEYSDLEKKLLTQAKTDIDMTISLAISFYGVYNKIKINKFNSQEIMENLSKNKGRVLLFQAMKQNPEKIKKILLEIANAQYISTAGHVIYEDTLMFSADFYYLDKNYNEQAKKLFDNIYFDSNKYHLIKLLKNINHPVISQLTEENFFHLISSPKEQIYLKIKHQKELDKATVQSFKRIPSEEVYKKATDGNSQFQEQIINFYLQLIKKFAAKSLKKNKIEEENILFSQWTKKWITEISKKDLAKSLYLKGVYQETIGNKKEALSFFKEAEEKGNYLAKEKLKDKPSSLMEKCFKTFSSF